MQIVAIQRRACDPCLAASRLPGRVDGELLRAVCVLPRKPHLRKKLKWRRNGCVRCCTPCLRVQSQYTYYHDATRTSTNVYHVHSVFRRMNRWQNANCRHQPDRRMYAVTRDGHLPASTQVSWSLPACTLHYVPHWVSILIRGVANSCVISTLGHSPCTMASCTEPSGSPGCPIAAAARMKDSHGRKVHGCRCNPRGIAARHRWQAREKVSRTRYMHAFKVHLHLTAMSSTCAHFLFLFCRCARLTTALRGRCVLLLMRWPLGTWGSRP